LIVLSRFKPAWWLTNRHAQTIFPTFFRRRPTLPLRRERLELPDGDFADCCWVGGATGPIVIVLHGLEGSIDSSYANGIMKLIEHLGWRGVVLHFRGCGGEPNRLSSGYHAGKTGDFDFLVTRLRAEEPDTPLAAVGFSLGGNVLLNWLGEQGRDAPLEAAAAVSVPFEPGAAADTVERGLSRIYNAWLLRSMRRSTSRKFQRIAAPFPLPELSTLKTFRQFDDAVTAPLNGFRDAADYYGRTASRAVLHRIAVPTLILQSRDDPVVGRAAIPKEDELSETVTLELSDGGGHVGFVAGRRPWAPEYWLETRIGEYLQARLKASFALGSPCAIERRNRENPVPARHADAAARSPMAPSQPASAADTRDSSAAETQPAVRAHGGAN
jgi:predicted alpha/beta-fold hydrolase